jgi:hypothetical protein
MSNHTNNSLIENCRLFELTVSQLYTTYSTQFPAEGDKWQAFAEEEKMHAHWLTILKNYVEEDIVSLKLTKISIQSINKTISYLQEHIQIARLGKVSLHDAIIFALQIENSIISKSFLNLFHFSTKEADDIRRYITKETIGHREQFTLWLDSVETRRLEVAA